MALINPASLKRKKNPSDRDLLYAALVGSVALGTLAYVTTHRAGPVIVGTLVGMVVTPVVLGADSRQLKKILL